MMFILVWMEGCRSEISPPRAWVREGMTSKEALPWQPGDDVPGWESYDYDCPFYSGADVATVYFPDVWMSVYRTGTDVRVEGIGAGVQLTVADCTDFSCYTTTGSNSGSLQIDVGAGEWPVASVFEKTGFYGTDKRPDTSAGANATLAIGSFIADATGGRSLDFEFCLSRVRPDELSGMIYARYFNNALPHDYFADILVQYPFDAINADHAAWDNDYGGYPTDEINQHSVVYAGDLDYDNTWDWDAITDPDIRATVYDRYTPANLP